MVVPPTPTGDETSNNTLLNGLDFGERGTVRDDHPGDEIRFMASPDPDDHTYSSREDTDSDEYHDTKETLDSEEEVVGGRGMDSDRARGCPDVAFDSDVAEKIVEQVEFYFSDANITKDKFLLKHIWRNKQGYVSIKLITSFKRVKQLTKDWQVVARVLVNSSRQLEVNEAGTKVRRKEPIPRPDKNSANRSVVITNFAQHEPGLDEVKGMMSPYGTVVLVRFFRPGTTLPQDVKEHQSAHPDFCVSLCVVVEFNQIDAAARVCHEMSKTENWRTGLRVKMLAKDDGKVNQNKTPDGSPVQRRKRSSKKKASRLEELVAMDGHSTCSSSEAEGLPIPTRSKRGSRSPRGTPDSSSYLSTSPTKTGKAGSRSHSPSPEFSRRVSPHSSPRPAVRRDHQSVSPRASPLLGERHMIDGSTGSSSARMAGKLGSGSPDWRVIRSPSGPDGTQGFVRWRAHLQSSKLS